MCKSDKGATCMMPTDCASTLCEMMTCK
jgi:hypothetical protein